MNQIKSIEPFNQTTPLLLTVGLSAILYGLISGKILITLGIIVLPLALICIIECIRKPILSFYILFICNYYIMALTRYVEFSGISYLMDGIVGGCLLTIILQTHYYRNYDWTLLLHNFFFWGMGCWLIYCVLLVANPSGMIQAWIGSRGVALNGFLICMLTVLLFTQFKYVKTLLFLLSIFVLSAIFKAFIQKYIGWDLAESRWLQNGGALTHIIGTGTRYFSFFTDAGNFGSNMGCAFIIYLFSGTFHKGNKLINIYYIIVSFLALYALFLSGTRGAMIVPLAGGALFIVISKRIHLMVIGSLFLFLFYSFFAFTSIGQDNAQIRRMRTAFQPSEDASFNVRRDNQRKLATYLANKPFGEGLGLSGVENQKLSRRFTTEIPHDSWYVKIWVETGIVGITLYMIIMFGSFAWASWILLFKVKNKELKGILSGILCGIFGMFISAYGNAFWGQYPTNIIAIWGIAVIFNAPYMETTLNNKTVNSKPICTTSI